MALFKIEKGLKADLTTKRPNKVEGYCYFTTDDGKFYTDTVSTDLEKNIPGNRVCLNADKADRAVKLETARTINGISFDGTANVLNYGVCNSEADA